MSGNKLAGKYGSFIPAISKICLLVAGMRSEIAHERQARAYLLFDSRCLFQSGATLAQSLQSSDRVSDSTRKRRKLETITALPYSVFE